MVDLVKKSVLIPFKRAFCFNIIGKNESAALNIAPPHKALPGFLFQKLNFKRTSICLKSSETCIIFIRLNIKGSQRLSTLFSSRGFKCTE